MFYKTSVLLVIHPLIEPFAQNKIHIICRFSAVVAF